MSKKRFFIGLVIIAAVLGTAGVSRALQAQQPEQKIGIFELLTKRTVDEMAKNSAAVILGTVEKTVVSKERSWLRDDEKDIMTTARIRVDEYLANPGHIKTKKVKVRTLGGTIGNTTVTVSPGSPAFEKGERVLVFLDRKGRNLFSVYGTVQGKYKVNSDGTLGTEREKQFLEMVFGKKDLKLDEFRSRL